MQQAVAPSHSLGEALSLKDTARSAVYASRSRATGCDSYVESALL